MKLFDKIKNILFDEEEVELPEIKSEEKREYEPPKPREEYVEPKRETRSVEEDINERELFETRQTFNFPAFLDEEKPKEKEEEIRRTRNINILDYDKMKKREKAVPKKEDSEGHKQFKPTPVISPVYGIVDGTIIQASMVITKEGPLKRDLKVNGSVVVEDVRNKAFGTLEDQIASTLDKPVEDFYDQDEKTKPIEELLINDLNPEEQEKNDDIIIESRVKTSQDKLDLLDEIEEELDNMNHKEERKEIPVEDTIESDLFKLIDSMYEDREDSEE